MTTNPELRTINASTKADTLDEGQWDDVLYHIKDMAGVHTVGYIGNTGRNYITDAWLHTVAKRWGWDMQDVSDFTTSKLGRHTLDHYRPMSKRAFADAMTEVLLGSTVVPTKYRGGLFSKTTVDADDRWL